MKLRVLLPGLVGLLITSAASASSGAPRCPRIPFNNWSVSQAGAGAVQDVAEDHIHIVRHNLDEAITMLEEDHVIRLSVEDASSYVDGELGAPAGPEGAYYLVRGVFANKKPHLSVSWQGATLRVFTGGMGCGTFEKQPLVVLLDRQPKWVSVTASSAL